MTYNSTLRLRLRPHGNAGTHEHDMHGCRAATSCLRRSPVCTAAHRCEQPAAGRGGQLPVGGQLTSLWNRCLCHATWRTGAGMHRSFSSTARRERAPPSGQGGRTCCCRRDMPMDKTLLLQPCAPSLWCLSIACTRCDGAHAAISTHLRTSTHARPRP